MITKKTYNKPTVKTAELSFEKDIAFNFPNSMTMPIGNAKQSDGFINEDDNESNNNEYEN